MNEKKFNNALRIGHEVHWYVIESVLGQGGFGITYLARDTNLDIQVAIKEFLPSQLAMRTDGITIFPVSDDAVEMYRWGLSRFITEARTLAKFKHPSIVRVNAVFESNNTAYMVMEYERGRSLNQYFDTHPPMDESSLRRACYHLLDGIELIHNAGFVHRDIKPDNIYLRQNDMPVLLDFGSARQALGAETRALTTLVTPGYAPFEQYNSTPDSDKQGPWTDIYALGATLYRGVCGQGPIEALSRANARLSGQPDVLIPAAELGKDRYSPAFLAAIDNALKFMPEERPQSIAAWRTMFLQDSGTLQINPNASSWGPAPVSAKDSASPQSTPVEPACEQDENATVLLPSTEQPPPHHRPKVSATSSVALPPSMDNAEGSIAVPCATVQPASDEAQAAPSTITGTPASAASPTDTTAHTTNHAASTAAAPIEIPAESAPQAIASANQHRGTKVAIGATLLALILVGSGIAYWRQQPPAAATVLNSPAAPADVKEALSTIDCSLLAHTEINGTLRLSGFTGLDNLSSTLAGTGKTINAEGVRQLDSASCLLLNTYRTAWRANQANTLPAKLSTSKAGNLFRSGEYLFFDVNAPAYEGYLYIDYFMTDGSVVHLLPSHYFTDNHVSAALEATFGDQAEWRVAAPFGTEIIVMLSTSTPLFNTPRQEHEDAAAYLSALQDAMQRRMNDPAASVSADLLVITTVDQ